MAACRWTEAMSVGVPTLDSDHRCLVRIINLLGEVEQGAEARTTIETVLESLAMYARYHFTREERLMGACGFPESRLHHDEHERFAAFVQSLRTRSLKEADAPLARELFAYLTAWLRHHILIQDMAYKPYVCAVGVESHTLDAALRCRSPAAARHHPSDMADTRG